MENEEFERKWKKAKNIYQEYTVALVGNGRIYPNDFLFLSCEGIDILNLFRAGQIIASIPIEFVVEVF